MFKYLLGRAFQAILTLAGLATFTFFLVRLSGDPIRSLLPANATFAMRDALTEALGLDRPLWEQYVTFMVGLPQGDLGTSTTTGLPVTELIFRAVPATAQLAGAAITVAVVVAIPLGILSALYRGSPIDTAARGLALFGQSVPDFWLAIMLIIVFGVVLGWLPIIYQGGPTSFVLPALVMGIVPVAGLVRLMRSSMLDVLSSDYLTMAHAKGLPKHTVVIKHGLRNALIPVITFAGLVIGTLANGSVIIENVFAWPGLGTVVLRSVTTRDFPAVQGVVLTIVALYLIINLIVDLVYVLIDPRMRQS